MITAALLLAALCTAARAEPAAFRGDTRGHFAVEPPAVQWTPEQNIRWQTDLEAAGNGCIVAAGDRLFTCSEPEVLVCLNADTGKLLWRRSSPVADAVVSPEAQRRKAVVAEYQDMFEKREALDKELNQVEREWRKDRKNEELTNKRNKMRQDLRDLDEKLKPYYEAARPFAHETNGWASPTPTTDGRNVYVLYGTGIAAAYDMEGNRLWIREVQRPTHQWGQSASPMLADGKLIIAIRDVFALDPSTGEELWRASSSPHWGTPVGTEIGGKPVVITCEGQILDAETGAELSKELPSLQWNTPLVVGDMVYTVDSRQGVQCHRLPASADGKPEQLWHTKPKNRLRRTYASPAMVDGILYGVDQRGTMVVLDAKTGEMLYEKQLELKGTIYPSPTVIGDYVYISSDEGQTIVLDSGAEYEEVAHNTLPKFRSSPVVHKGRIYIRANKSALCISE